jgi:hypothetical protein
MQKTLGTVLAIGGFLWMAFAYFAMSTLVGTIEREQIHNIGLMHAREVNLFVGGVFFLAGVFLLGGQQPAITASAAESDEDAAKRLGITFDGESYVINAKKFSSLEAALLFAKR